MRQNGAKAKRQLRRVKRVWRRSFRRTAATSGAENYTQKLRAWITENAPKAVLMDFTCTPTKATGNVPTLTVEQDNSVFVGGDFTKHDEYHLAYRIDRSQADSRHSFGGTARSATAEQWTWARIL